MKRLLPSFSVDLLTGTAASSTQTSPQPVADVEIIERSLHSVDNMLDRVLSYVQSVLSGEKQGDAAIGRYLMDTLGAATDDLEKSGFNSSLQVCTLGPFPLICRSYVALITGYPHDFIPRQPRPLPGRSFRSPCSGHRPMKQCTFTSTRPNITAIYFSCANY